MPYKEKIRKLFSREEIERVLERIAKEIKKDFDDEEILFVCLLKGSFMFTADLIRRIDNPAQVDFMRVSSYGVGKESKGELTLTKDVEESLEGKNVILIEDIVDSGLTLKEVKEMLLKRNPKRFKICVLIDKKARRKVDVGIDYVGFEMQDGFVVGYGIDYAERFRNLPEVFVIEE